MIIEMIYKKRFKKGLNFLVFSVFEYFGQILMSCNIPRNFKIITISSLYQVIDGYFAHFVAPENLPPMAKHAVFVLDVSGSMSGQKLLQVKNAMKSILDQLRDMDFFSILHFSDKVTGNCFSKTYRPYPRQ